MRTALTDHPIQICFREKETEIQRYVQGQGQEQVHLTPANALSTTYYYKTKTKFQWLQSDKFTHLNIRKVTSAVFLHNRLKMSSLRLTYRLQLICKVDVSNRLIATSYQVSIKTKQGEKSQGPSAWTTALINFLKSLEILFHAKSKHYILQHLVLLTHIQFHLWPPNPLYIHSNSCYLQELFGFTCDYFIEPHI